MEASIRTEALRKIDEEPQVNPFSVAARGGSEIPSRDV